ncbi:hypothetical protein AGMMS49546_02710 [Spirochaetia bacterium]|nr:hypothetical protein AGMMS49546_02710 [Spirochaetia bacterium]
MKKLAPASMALILTFLMVSCPQDEPGDVSGNFWAQNFSTEAFYQIDAIRLAEGQKCLIWAEKSAGVSTETAEQIAREYDNNIYGKMMNVFGVQRNFTNEGVVVAHDTLELADWLGDGDGKLAILLLDIKDGYTSGGGYVAGYFWAGNFLQIEHSNQIDMMYVDIKPGIPGSPSSNKTFAHELEHLMNFATTVAFRTTLMDTWIDEGLATAAEYVYLAPNHNEDRINFFNIDRGDFIAKGNNFFVWGNHEDANSYAALGDYATAYLFFQWLRLQSSNGTGIYKEIISSTYPDYRAVTDAARTKMSETNYTNNPAGWGLLLGDWMAANYIKSTSGRYGYKNDSVIGSSLNTRYISGGTTIPLYPGEGVYSKSNDSSALPAASGNIKYAGLSSTGVSNSNHFSDGRRLTYNVNTNTTGAAANGQLTGVAASMASISGIAQAESFDPAVGSISRSAARPSGPFAIDARDMLRRKGHEGWGNVNFGSLPMVETDAAE